ncbi:hypothetical protein BH20ACI4_BH20ACI4_07170 [soil metagenome]
MIKNTKTIDEKDFARQFREAKKRGEENSARQPQAVSVGHENGRTFVEFATGWNLSFDPRQFSELKEASEKDLEQVKIWGPGYTLEWTNLDAHIGIGAIMLKLIGEKYLASELHRQHDQSKRKSVGDEKTERNLIMKYVILKSEKTNKIVKVGRFAEDGITESFRNGEWTRDRILYSELLDGLLEEISKVEAEKIITQMLEREKIAA